MAHAYPLKSGLLLLVFTASLSSCSLQNEEDFQENWIIWIEDNHHEIRSLEADLFSDLQFMKGILEDKRIVQLGESTSTVAQFNQVKVRMIKFLHQEMGFDVIAFQSNLFECFFANKNIDGMTSKEAMLHSILGRWHTEEVLELFDYIKSTQQTDRPLILAGIDVYTSTSLGSSLRPGFLHDVIEQVDPRLADEVFVLDAEIISNKNQGFALYENYVINNRENILQVYQGVADFLREHSNQLALRYTDEPLVPLMTEQTVWTIIQEIESIATRTANPLESLAFRDRGMADNIDFLADQVYPDKKLIIWGHNFNLRHNNDEITYPGNVPSNDVSMGSWLFDRRKNELYTVGMVMNKGQAAWNGGSIFNIAPASGTSLEAICKTTQSDVFVDMQNQVMDAGNSWMFTERVIREWGLFDFRMVPKDQYDGILLINDVTPPNYLTR